MKKERSKEISSDNPGHYVLEIHKILVQIQIPTCKAKLDI